MTHKSVSNQENNDSHDLAQDFQGWSEVLFGDDLSFLGWEEAASESPPSFWVYEPDCNTTSWIILFDWLVQRGIELPAPEEFDDTELTLKLWEIIRGMAELRMFLYSTNHLSDHELYEVLWHEELREEYPHRQLDENSAWHIDILGGCGEEDNLLYLRYYADEGTRRIWAKDWPDYEIPERETPPYDRDRYLPVCYPAQ